MSELQALIFDVDGTLAETERDGHRVAFNAAFAEAGLDWHWSVAHYGELLRVTGGKERILYDLRHRCPDFQPPGGDVSAFVADLHRRKTAHYLALLAQGGIPLRPGVLRLLREARAAGVRLAIATTTTAENVTALLAQAGEPGVADWFEVIAAGDIVPHKKPAPDIFVWTLRALQLPPAACAVIEDSDHGVQAARGAGLKTVVVTVSAYTRGQDFSSAAVVVDSLGEPESPALALSGDLDGAQWVDLALLRRLHRRLWAARA